MAVLVVSGTNTDVGKTVALAAVASAVRARAAAQPDSASTAWVDSIVVVKVAQSGACDGLGDIAAVRSLLEGEPGCPVTYEEFASYPEPLAPNLAAQRAGMEELDLWETTRRIRALDGPNTLVLVEGSGGLLVRIASDWTIADLAEKLSAPVLVVSSTRLGCLNSAELTVEAALRRGVKVAGVVGGAHPKDADLAAQLNVSELAQVTGVEMWGTLPEKVGSVSPAEFTRIATDCLGDAVGEHILARRAEGL